MQSEDGEKPEEASHSEGDDKVRKPEDQPEDPTLPSDKTALEADPAGQWSFHVEGTEPELASPDLLEAVSWTASEYVAHQKSASWFIGLGGAIVVLSAVIYVLTRDLTSTIMVAIFGAAFGVFAARQPQVLSYSLDERGLQAGNKLYRYERFKSFSIIEEGPVHSILLMPLQRFMPSISIYYGPEDEDKILQVISSYLPHEGRSHDMVERLMRKIRF